MGEQALGSDIEAELALFQDQFRQHRYIAVAKVDALPCDRVDAMRRIADQCEAVRGELLRMHQLQRVAETFAHHLHRAPVIIARLAHTALQLAVKFFITECDILCRIVRMLRPHDAAAVHAVERFQWQQREWSYRIEFLERETIMRLRMLDDTHDRCLVIGDHARGDPRLFTQFAEAAIRRDEQWCGQRLPILQRRGRARNRGAEPRHLILQQRDVRLAFKPHIEPATQDIILDDIAERLAYILVRIMHEARLILVAHADVMDGLRMWRNMLPYVHMRQDAHGAGGDRARAPIEPGGDLLLARQRVDDRNLHAALRQRDGQRIADQPPTCDDDFCIHIA